GRPAAAAVRVATIRAGGRSPISVRPSGSLSAHCRFEETTLLQSESRKAGPATIASRPVWFERHVTSVGPSRSANESPAAGAGEFSLCQSQPTASARAEALASSLGFVPSQLP